MLRHGFFGLGGIVLACSLMSSVTVAAPSFSCDGRLNQTETVICSDDDLSDLDVKLHDAFTRFMRTQTGADRGGNQDVQSNWLEERNQCRYDKDCIRDAYIRRLGEIASYAPTPDPDVRPPRPPAPDRDTTTARPSFRCDGRLNDTESAICSDDELARLDVRLHDVYTRFMRTQTGADRGGNQDVQNNWLDERNACRSDTDCIRDAYNRRIKEIASYSRSDEPQPRNEPSVTMLGHNGSTIEMSTDANNNVVMRYSSVRAGLPVREGTVLFKGTVDANGWVNGTAYVFKRGCPPASYDVSGEKTNSRILLRGEAPIFETNSCDIASYDPSSRNSRLEFTIAE